MTLFNKALPALALTLVLFFQAGSPTSSVSSTDYEIYSEVLRTHYVTDKVKHLVIGDHTMMPFPPLMMGYTEFGGSPEMKKIRSAAAKETFGDYDEKNKTPIPLENKFTLRVPVVLLSESERDKIFGIKGEGDSKSAKPRGFEELNRLYPDSPGFMNLSRIGLNHNNTQALVYVGNLCGGLCGAGEFFLLEKQDGVWKVKYAATTWVS